MNRYQRAYMYAPDHRHSYGTAPLIKGKTTLVFESECRRTQSPRALGRM